MSKRPRKKRRRSGGLGLPPYNDSQGIAMGTVLGLRSRRNGRGTHLNNATAGVARDLPRPCEVLFRRREVDTCPEKHLDRTYHVAYRYLTVRRRRLPVFWLARD